MRDILITNNPLVSKPLSQSCEIVFIQGEMLQILKATRDYIHGGHRLLTHPLSGSVKPNENPYKSILISSGTGSLDLDSLDIIEKSIATAEKFPIKYSTMSEQMKDDFKMIDYSLIKSAFANKI